MVNEVELFIHKLVLDLTIYICSCTTAGHVGLLNISARKKRNEMNIFVTYVFVKFQTGKLMFVFVYLFNGNGIDKFQLIFL